MIDVAAPRGPLRTLGAATLLLVLATGAATWAASSRGGYGLSARIAAGWEHANRQSRGLPLINPWQFNGQPQVANPQTLAFYPPHLPLRVLPFEWFLAGTLAIHGWLAAFGSFLVARRLSATWLPSIAAGVAVMLALVIVHGPALTYDAGAVGASLAPLALAFAMRSTERHRLMPHPVLVAVAATVLLAASVRNVAAVGGMIASWYAAVALWPSDASAPRRYVAQAVLLAILATGVSAVVVVPAASLQFAMAAVGGLTVDVPSEGSWHDRRLKPLLPDQALTAVLAPLRGHRTIGACDAIADAGQLAALGIPVVTGYGGLLLSDYARFTNLASGLYPERPSQYQGLTHVGHPPTRRDLLQFLAAEYLITCEPPEDDGWDRVAAVGTGGVYAARNGISRAMWTCTPVPIGRNALESRLTQSRYDATLSLREAGHMMNVRWAAGTTEEQQRSAEAAFHLERDRFLGDRTWRYQLLDVSPANISAIVSNAAVEDTAGVDRRTLAVVTAVPSPEPQTEWLVGGASCPDTHAASVMTKDRGDGRVVARVDAPREGIVLFADTYDPQRVAYVNGRAVRPLKVNFAFTAVPVPAGVSRVEIAYSRRLALTAAGVSVLSTMLWVMAEWRQV